VSTGGGIVEVRKNLDYMYYTGIVVYLQASFQEILQRLKYDRNRPLWNQDCDTRKHLYNRRQILYEAYADVTINTDSRSIDNIAREIRQFCDCIRISERIIVHAEYNILKRGD